MFDKNKTKLFSKTSSKKSNSSDFSSFISGNGIAPRKTDSMILKSYDESPWLHAVVSKIAFAVSTVEIEYKNLKGDAIENPVLSKIVEEMNPILTPIQNRMLLCMYLDLIGRAYCVCERNKAGKIIEIYPVNPLDIVSEPNQYEDFYRIIFVDTVKDIHKSDVIKFWNPSPVNPMTKSIGFGSALSDEIETDEYAAKFSKDFFINRARPDLVVTANGLKKEDTERLESRWNDSLRGVTKQFKTFFMNRQVEITRLDTNFKDMNLVELRKSVRDEIVSIAGVPPELLGILSSSNRGTITHAEHMFNVQVVKPRITMILQTLQKFLVEDSYKGNKISAKKFVSSDRDFLFAVMTRFPQAFTQSEARKLVGLTGEIKYEDSLAFNDKKPAGNNTPRVSEDPVS